MLFAMNQDPSVLYQCTIAFLSEDHCSSTFYSTSTKKTDDKKKEKGYLPTRNWNPMNSRCSIQKVGTVKETVSREF